MKKILFLLAIMASATLLATAQEGGRVKYTVSGEKVTYTRTLTPVPAGTMVVKKPPVAGNTAKKRSAPPEHSARDSRGTNSSETPAWKRAQEQTRRKLTMLEDGQRQNTEDISDIRRSQSRTEVRLDMIEHKVDMISTNLSNAQALQKNAQGSQRSQTQTTFDFERYESNRRTVRAVVITGLVVGVVAGVIYSFVKNSKNNNQAYQPPTPAPNPAPNPNSGTGGPVTVPVIP